MKNRLKQLRVYRNTTQICKTFDLAESVRKQEIVPQNEKNCCVSLASSHPQQGFTASDVPSQVCEYCKHTKRESSFRTPKNNCNFDFASSLSYVSDVFSNILPFGSFFHKSAANCLNSLDYYNTNEYRTLCCKQCGVHTMSNINKCSYRKVTDSFVAKSYLRFQSNLCKKLRLENQQELVLPSHFTDVGELNYPEFQGAGHQTNKSVNVIHMDIKYNSLLVKRLFPDYSVNMDSPASFLVDKKVGSEFVSQYLCNYFRLLVCVL